MEGEVLLCKRTCYAEKLVAERSRGEFEHRSRIAHLELADLLEVTGQQRRAKDINLKGLALSTRAKVNYHSGQFLSSLLLCSLYENDIQSAKDYLVTIGINRQTKAI